VEDAAVGLEQVNRMEEQQVVGWVMRIESMASTSLSEEDLESPLTEHLRTEEEDVLNYMLVGFGAMAICIG
jgi:hypothetical protein